MIQVYEQKSYNIIFKLTTLHLISQQPATSHVWDGLPVARVPQLGTISQLHLTCRSHSTHLERPTGEDVDALVPPIMLPVTMI